MKKEESKTNFDLSALSLEELLKVHENITSFLKFLEEKKVKTVEKGTKSNG